MRVFRRIARLSSVAAMLFLGVNYSWTHAALAYAVNETQCDGVLEEKARSAVIALFGSTTANPIIVCLNQPTLGLRVDHGSIRFAPLLPSIIVLGPEGQNIDVASHEFSHAELRQRTSVLLRTYRIPTWFDEGLAMQLDHRQDYTDVALRRYLLQSEIEPIRLPSLSRPSGFYVQGDVGKAHYAFANCVVRDWLTGNHKGLNSLIDQVGWFQKFPTDQFDQSESICLTP